MHITTTVSTRGRYDTTLPLTLVSIANQVVVPNDLIIFDDNQPPTDLRNNPLYQYIFSLLSVKGINWSVLFTGGRGQVANHQAALEIAKGDFIHRVDDDEVLDPACLIYLRQSMMNGVGAVGGLVLDPKNVKELPSFASNRLEDIYTGFNIQWFKFEGIKDVDHLTSTFLYRKEAASSYCKELSPIGHREESIFVFEIKRKGWKVLVDPRAITWHLRFPLGGIRNNNQAFWDFDEKIFQQKLKEWGVTPRKRKLIVLNSGLGDHLIFKQVLPEIKTKYPDLMLAVCYPEVFEDEKNIQLISIADAMLLGDITQYSVYKWCIDHNHKESMINVYRRMYL